MGTIDNKAQLKRYMEAVWERGNFDAIDEFVAPTYKRHTSPQSAPLTRELQKNLLRSFRAAFPDITVTVDAAIAEGDVVAFRSTMRGTHKGEFLGIAPTGREVTVGLVDMLRLENGRFAEQWGGPNLLDMARQLGASLSVEQAGAAPE